MKSKELCIFLERLRFARNISQENFIEDVVSIRQYRRYLTGESDIPFQMIAKLTSKIGVKTDSLLREFEVAKNEETALINKLYNLAINYQYEEFIINSSKIPIDHIIEYNNRVMYQHSIILNDLFAKKITIQEAAEANAKLINYPKILTQQLMTTVEMLILSSLLDLFPTTEHEKIVEIIVEFVNDKSIVISGGNEKIFTLVLQRLSKYMGVSKDYESVIKYCQLGIKRNIDMYSFYLLDYFYYYAALAHYRLGNIEAYEVNIVACFNILQLDVSNKKVERFTKWINKDFDINFEEFVVSYLQKKYQKIEE